MKLQYPLQKKDGTSYVAYTAQELFEKLATEQSGFYLLANYNFWHGGVHFSDTTTPDFKNTPVRAIADGTIIAYRINDQYEKLDLSALNPNGSGQAAGTATGSTATEAADDPYKFKYSTSFCLIKHEYKSPDASLNMLPSKKEEGAKYWEGRIVEFKESRVVRDPTYTATAETGNTFKATIQVKSRVEIIKVAADGHAEAKIISLADSKGTAITELKNTLPKPDKVNEARAIGATIYFAALNGTAILQGSSSKKDIFAEVPRTDWSKTKTLTLQANRTAYTQNPAILNTTPTATLPTVELPSGTTLQKMEGGATATVQGQVYYLVTAQQDFNIITPPASAPNAASATPPKHTAGSALWVALTDKDGITPTVQDSKGKDIPVAKAVPETNKLTFYSLYMHLLPFSEYGKDPLAGKIFMVSKIGNSTAGDPKNLDERSLPIDAEKDSAGNKIIDTLGVPKGTIYELVSTTISTDSSTHKGRSVDFYEAYRVDAQGKRLDAQGQPDANAKAVWIKVNCLDEHIIPSSAPEYPMHWAHGTFVECTVNKSVDAHQTDSKGAMGKIGTGLTAGAVFTYAVPAGLNNPTAQFIECTLKNGQVVGNKNVVLIKAGDTFYLDKAHLVNVQQKITPTRRNMVIPCNPPIKVSGGDILGNLGLYESPQNLKTGEGKTSRHQLHFEIFSNDEARINDFMDNKAKVTAGRQYLKITSGAKLVIGTNFDTPATTITNLNPHYFEDDKTPTLKSDWYWELSKTNLSKDSSGAEWYQLPIAKQPDKTFGWIKKGDSKLNIIGQYDLKELGFTPIKEDEATKTHGDVFVDAEQVKAGRNNNVLQHFFGDIIKEIDNLGAAAEKGDGKLSLSEIQKAYADQDGLGQTLQKIVGYYPTEWYNAIDIKSMMANRVKLKIYTSGTQAQKDRIEQIKADTEQILTEFITPENKYFIDQEQQRVNKLMFWDKVPELTSTPKVYHFHPVKFIEQLQVEAIVTYHIYADHTIEKHVPSSISDKYKNMYRYIYHDKNGVEHHVCDVPWHEIKGKKNGTKYLANYLTEFSKNVADVAGQTIESNLSEVIDEGTITQRITYKNGDIHITIYNPPNSGIDIQQRVMRTNGDIYEYSSGYSWRKYAVDTVNPKDIELVHVPNGLKIEHNGQHIMEFAFHDTARFYANPNLFAGFIGVIGQIGFKAESTGFAFEQGSCFPSSEHANGESFDFRYFTRAYGNTVLNQSKDKTVVGAAKDFYFEKRLAGSEQKPWLVGATGYPEDHSDHFHFGEFKVSIVKEIKG